VYRKSFKPSQLSRVLTREYTRAAPFPVESVVFFSLHQYTSIQGSRSSGTGAVSGGDFIVVPTWAARNGES
jgi:hypothetical protein